MIRDWWTQPNMFLSATFRCTDEWKDYYQFIPTKEMIITTLKTTIKQTFQQECPNHEFPDPNSVLESFLQPNTNWKINFFKSVKNDCNGFNSGVIKINDKVLAEREGVDGNLVYDPFTLTHVYMCFTILCGIQKQFLLFVSDCNNLFCSM